MKILLTNIWMSANTGDNAIWKNMCKHLSNEFKNVEFLMSVQEKIPWDVEQLKKYNIRYLINDGCVPTKENIEEADIVISQGGGYMIGDGMKRFLEMFKYAQELGKPTFFATQTFVGPVSEETSILISEVLNNAKLVIPREKQSFDFLLSCGVNEEKMQILPDQVFDIDIKEYKNDYPKDSVKIGIRSYSVDDSILNNIAKLSDMITETIGNVVLIPIGHGGNRNDIDGIEKIYKYAKHKSYIYMVKDKLSAEELKFILKDGILISDRYHGIIYSASMFTPFVPLSPDIDNKMPGLLDLLNYPNKTILNISNTEPDDIFNIAIDVWKNRFEYRKLLEELVPNIKEKSRLIYKNIIEKIYENIRK